MTLNRKLSLRSLACGVAIAAIITTPSFAAPNGNGNGNKYGHATGNKNGGKRRGFVPCAQGPLSLQILHSSDNESSFVDPNTLEPKALNYATVVSALETYAQRRGMATIHVTAGDHTLPGPFYQAAAEAPSFGFPGGADIALFNSLGVDANGIGNHELDGGLDQFADMIATADYPFVSVNLDFDNAVVSPGFAPLEFGEDGGLASDNGGKLVHSTVIRVRGNCVGVIARAPADFFNVINDPDTTLPGVDFIGGRDGNNQPLLSAIPLVLDEVEALENMGVNKIILLDHAQDFTGDPLAAKLLRGIDVFVTAGSTGFMAKPFADGPFNLLRPEDTPGPIYPTEVEDMEGKNVLVVNSDQLFRYVGNLMLKFDKDGEIVWVDERSGPVATTEAAIDLLADLLNKSGLSAPSAVAAILDEIQSTDLIQSAFEVIGTTAYPLNGLRADVRTRETNLGRLAADSTLAYTRSQYGFDVDVALKNGGGIRDTILGPNIIRLTIQAALAFDNQLAVVELSADQLIAVMENSVSRAPAADGRFPQVAGMFVEFDLSQPALEAQTSVVAPSRIKTLHIFPEAGGTDVLIDNYVAQGDLSRTFVMATNNFLLTGGDGYAALNQADLSGNTLAETTTGEQEILENYIQNDLGGAVNLMDPPPTPRIVNVTPVP